MIASSIVFTATCLSLTVTAPQTVSVRVQGSIEASLNRSSARFGPALAAQVARLLRWRGDIIRDVHPGDHLALNFEVDGDDVPNLLALRYRGASISLEAYRFEGADGVARYFDQDGLMIEPRMQDNPVPGYVQITEDVQNQRGLRPHNGLDLKADIGAPVYLPFDAIVHRVNWSTTTNGTCIEVVYRKSGIIARFLHLDSIAAGIKVGSALQAGSPLGAVGNTGRSSAPHLHYELRTESGAVLRPLEIHGTEPATVDPEHLSRFQATVARLRLTLDGVLAMRQP